MIVTKLHQKKHALGCHVPADVRRALQLRAGDYVVWVLQRNGTVIVERMKHTLKPATAEAAAA